MNIDQPIESNFNLSAHSSTSSQNCDRESTSPSELRELREGDQCKQLLLDLTPYTLIPAKPARKISEFFDSLSNLDPIKYSPPDTGKAVQNITMSHSHTSYSSFAKLNPFREERYTQMGDFYDSEAWRVGTGVGKAPRPPPIYGHKSPGMSHSQSEGNIDFRAPATNTRTLRAGTTFHSQHDHASELNGGTDVSPTFSRGRRITRTPSPVKLLEDIKEDQMVGSAPSPAKRSRSPMKQLFGENGWLGRSTSMNELPDEKYRKTGIKHWGGKIKERVENITEDVARFNPKTLYQRESPSKSPAKSKFHVSLSPPLQAKLYSEMELMICATANQYLNVQQEEGRMTVESLTKVTQYWTTKNRPQVIEFMFDQATQRDLVLYNLKTFRFYGSNAENVVLMNSMMQSWKALAREMSVRTFCAPDSVIRRHMQDCYKILELLGAPLVTFLAFQEIQVKALKTMREEQKKRDEYEAIKFGVERKWEPPAGVKDRELDNPFA